MVVVLIVIAALLIGAGLFIWLTYNRLVASRNVVDSSWSQIDVALRQRHDLIPALVEAVRGYAGHERATLEEVTSARAGATAIGGGEVAKRASAEGGLARGVGSLMILAEDYPELRATENFTELQAQLAAAEERIAITRRVYNDAVERYNTRIQVFPAVIVARRLGFEEREFFDAPVAAEIAPEVSLGGRA